MCDGCLPNFAFAENNFLLLFSRMGPIRVEIRFAVSATG
jgi:hypothetical protein